MTSRDTAENPAPVRTPDEMAPWLIASGDFTPLGGMDRANHALAAFLARSGRAVHLVTHRAADDLARSGVVVHRVARPAGSNLLGAPLLARRIGREARALGAGARVLINGGNAPLAVPTWVHYVHAAHRPVSAASVTGRVTGRLAHYGYLAAERHVMGRTPLAICNSQRTARDLETAYGLGADRLRVVYYGVDAATFGAIGEVERRDARRALGLPERGTSALFVGALGDRRKGFDVLFEAWRALAADAAFDVDLLVVGAGAERARWEARAAEAGLRRMRFIGFRADVDAILAASDLLVHPVRYEAYGLGVHEAICRGLPAIVTESAGVAERYPRDLAGLLLPDPPTARALVTALRAWYPHRDLWRPRAAAFGTVLRSRSWDDMAADIAGLVEAA